MTDVQRFDAFIGAGGSLAMLAEIDPQDIGALYAEGNRCFAAGDMARAQSLYFLVVSLDAWDYGGWLALGICHQRAARHSEALFCFAKAALLRWRDPQPPFLASYSYLMKGNRRFACKALRAAIRWSKRDARSDELHRTAVAALARIDDSPQSKD